MITPSPQAFSPGSATLIFLPCKGTTVLETFAKGSAIALQDGVTAAVRSATVSQIYFNGQALDLPPVQSVLDLMIPEPVQVHLETTLPLGCGFGVSAACSLSTAFALAKKFDLNLTREQLATFAHTAEVNSGTGIGDVATQINGGIVYRRGETGPFDCIRMNLNVTTLHYRIFAPLSTKDVLRNPKFQSTLALEGERGIQWLHDHHALTTIDQLLDRSLEFAEKTELLTDSRVKSTIDQIHHRDAHATMVMLGQSVIATLPLSDSDSEWRSCLVDEEGTRWL